MHSHDYRSMEGFQGKTVIIIGIGNSAGDLAADLSKVAKHVSRAKNCAAPLVKESSI